MISGACKALRRIAFGSAVALMLGAGSGAASEDWVVGRWVAVHDPEGRPADVLEFTPEGDAYNVWADGTRVPGMYILTAEGVKAVFTHQGRDIIATFHASADRRALRIVTGASGAETVYEKTQ